MYVFTSGSLQQGMHCETAGQRQSSWQRGAAPAVFRGWSFASDACWVYEFVPCLLQKHLMWMDCSEAVCLNRAQECHNELYISRPVPPGTLA